MKLFDIATEMMSSFNYTSGNVSSELALISVVNKNLSRTKKKKEEWITQQSNHVVGQSLLFLLLFYLIVIEHKNNSSIFDATLKFYISEFR